MTYDELNDGYFAWLYELIDNNDGLSYSKLLRCIHEIDFTYNIAMDSNREGDGIDLRYRFGYDHDIDSRIISTYIDNRPCSVFEMMVALAVRCEESIMEDPDIGPRPYRWFWGMISNLGLDDMDNEHFDDERVLFIIGRLLDREYAPDGRGGLFTVRHHKRDLRTVEIWYQMSWYLDEWLSENELLGENEMRC